MRRWLLLVFFVLLLILMLYSRRIVNERRARLPDYFLKTTLRNLHTPVEINYDLIGVPHIRASNPQDMAAAVGWVQAQDRWLILDYLRHWLDGDLPDTLPEFNLPPVEPCPFRHQTLELATSWVGRLTHEQKDELEAYSEGFNGFLEWMKIHARPIGIPAQARTHIMEPWKPGDSLKMAAWFWLRVEVGSRFLDEQMTAWNRIAKWDTLLPQTLETEDENHLRCSALNRELASRLIGPIIFWSVLRGPSDEAPPRPPLLLSIMWMEPTWPGPLYRIHLQFPRRYLAGDMIGGTPFLTNGRANFVAWTLFSRPKINWTGAEPPSLEPPEGPRLPTMSIHHSRPYPSALDWESSIRSLKGWPVQVIAADYYGNRLVGPYTLCPGYVWMKRFENHCEIEWEWQNTAGITVCPGAFCIQPTWKYPTWYELALFVGNRQDETSWPDWAHLPKPFQDDDWMKALEGTDLHRALSPDALSLDDLQVPPLIFPTLAPAFLIRLPAFKDYQPSSYTLKFQAFFPESAPESEKELLLTRKGWSYFDPRGQVWQPNLFGDFWTPEVTYILWSDPRVVHALQGLMVHPNSGLGGKVLGHDLYRQWIQGIPHVIQTDSTKVLQVTVGRQVLQPAR